MTRLPVPILVGMALFAVTSGSWLALGQRQAVRECTVSMRQCSFSPERIDVTRGDIVRLTLVAEDGPHGFVIDAYRIAKRAVPGHPVTFEFLADRPGTFPFYSDLNADGACRDVRGELIVHDAPPAPW